MGQIDHRETIRAIPRTKAKAKAKAKTKTKTKICSLTKQGLI